MEVCRQPEACRQPIHKYKKYYQKQREPARSVPKHPEPSKTEQKSLRTIDLRIRDFPPQPPPTRPGSDPPGRPPSPPPATLAGPHPAHHGTRWIAHRKHLKHSSHILFRARESIEQRQIQRESRVLKKKTFIRVGIKIQGAERTIFPNLH